MQRPLPPSEDAHNRRQFSALMTFLLWIIIGMIVMGAVNAILSGIDPNPDKRTTTTETHSGYDCHNARVHYVRNTGDKVYFAVEGRLRTIVGTQADAWIQVGTVLDVCNR